MDNISLSLFVGVLSGVLSSVITYLATRSKVRLDLAAEYDKNLRTERLQGYKELWRLMKPFSTYAPESPLTYKKIKSISDDMRDWYYEKAGIFLSKESLRRFIELSVVLKDILDNETLKEDINSPIDTTELKSVTRASQDLREALAEDIRARKNPFI